MLEALAAGGLKLHRHRPHRTVAEVVGPAVAVPAPSMGPLPLGDLERFGNGRLPAGRLASIGGGEQLAAPAAKHFRRMAATARATGVPLPVLGAYRSYAEQAALRAEGGAAPGTSSHGWGLSVDLDVPDPSWLQEHAARYGFFADSPTDPAHWTYRPA